MKTEIQNIEATTKTTLQQHKFKKINYMKFKTTNTIQTMSQ